MKFESRCYAVVSNPALRLEHEVILWVEAQIAAQASKKVREYNCWDCFLAMHGSNGFGSSPGHAGMDALREWGVLAGNAGWKTLFSRICAEHGVEPSFRRKNAEGETDSNARVGFEQPEIPTKPAKKVTAAVKQIDYSAIAAATRAMSTPKMGGMGDIS